MNKRLLQQAIRANRLADEYDRLANKVVQQYVEAVCPLKSGMIISKRNQVNRIYYFYVDKIGGWLTPIIQRFDGQLECIPVRRRVNYVVMVKL